MNLKRKSLIFTLLILKASILSSCGGSRYVSPRNSTDRQGTPSAGPSSSDQSLLAQKFTLIEGQTNHPDRPNLNPHQDPDSPLNHRTVDGNEILYHGKLFLPDSPKGDFFFAWPDDLLGSPIESATYTHQVFSQERGQIGDLSPHQVWHDTETHRWFVPLSEIFKNRTDYGPLDVDLADLQVLTLEIAPKEGPNQVFHIKFQSAGPLPKIDPEVPNRVAIAPPETFVRLFSREGGYVHEESLKNPTARTLDLWVRLDNSHLQLSSDFHHQTYTNDPKSVHPPVPQTILYSSYGKFFIDRVDLIREQVESRNLSDGWVRFKLNPHETVTLKWHALPDPTTPRCSIPGPTHEERRWINPLPSFLPGTGIMISPPFSPHAQQFPVNWHFIAGQISGEISREVRIAHPFLVPEEVTGSTDSPLFNTLIKDRQSIDFGHGRKNGANYHCQGIFP